jgi:hypothetical protein
MASTTDVCKQVHDKVDDCLAVGVVDLGSGMLMGVFHAVPHFTQAYLDAVAAAAVDMFRGKTVRRVEELLSNARGKEVKDSFEEIFISSPHTYHFMAIIKSKSAAVVMVTKKTANQGLGWAFLRNNMKALEASLP